MHRGIIAVIGLTCAVCACAAQATVNLTSPVGGEVWTAGEEVSVTWTISPPTSATDEIVILIRRGIDGPGALIRFAQDFFTQTVVAGDGLASFSVPTWLGNGNDYYVELRSGEFTKIRESDVGGPITINGSGSIKRLDIRTPRAGDRWRAGGRNHVAWDHTGAEGLPVEFLLRPGAVVYAQRPATDGWASLKVPENIGNATNFSIQLIEPRPLPRVAGQAVAFDEVSSIEIFDALPRPTFFITTPNGSEVLTGGDDVQICWGGTSQDVRASVMIVDRVMTPGGRLYSSAPIEDGCVSRPVCPHINGTQFRVFGAAESSDPLDILRGGYLSLIDFSDEVFSISSAAPAPTLTLTSLNDAGTLTPNQAQDIEWTSTGFAGTEFLLVSLVTYTDSETKVVPIGFARVSDGLLATTSFCPDADPNATYRVRICVAPDFCPEVCAESAKVFLIQPIEHDATLTIVRPTGGELFRDGSFVDFEYEASNVAGMTIDVRRQVGSGFLNAFESGPALDGGGTLSDRIRLPYGEIPSRAYRLVAQLEAGACTILQRETGFFTVKNLTCTCADIDGDLLVNLDDASDLVSCMGTVSGSSVICNCSDLDGSGIVDLRDFGGFQNLFGIGDAAEPPNCPQTP